MIDSEYGMPADIHPDLAWDRLDFIAEEVWQIRDEVAVEAKEGDIRWNLSSTGYARTMHRLTKHSAGDQSDWLYAKKRGNALDLRIGKVPARMIRADRTKIQKRHAKARTPEQGELALAFHGRGRNGVFRIVVELDEREYPVAVLFAEVFSDGSMGRHWVLRDRGTASGGVVPTSIMPVEPVADIPLPVIGDEPEQEKSATATDLDEFHNAPRRMA